MDNYSKVMINFKSVDYCGLHKSYKKVYVEHPALLTTPIQSAILALHKCFFHVFVLLCRPDTADFGRFLIYNAPYDFKIGLKLEIMNNTLHIFLSLALIVVFWCTRFGYPDYYSTALISASCYYKRKISLDLFVKCSYTHLTISAFFYCKRNLGE